VPKTASAHTDSARVSPSALPRHGTTSAPDDHPDSATPLQRQHSGNQDPTALAKDRFVTHPPRAGPPDLLVPSRWCPADCVEGEKAGQRGSNGLSSLCLFIVSDLRLLRPSLGREAIPDRELRLPTSTIQPACRLPSLHGFGSSPARMCALNSWRLCSSEGSSGCALDSTSLSMRLTRLAAWGRPCPLGISPVSSRASSSR